MNASYGGIYLDSITLADGLYEEQPLTVVQCMQGIELYSNLGGDTL